MSNTYQFAGARFNNTYQKLPECFYSRLSPTPVNSPSLIAVNPQLAEQLGLDPKDLSSPQATAVFAGNIVPIGAAPIAQVYSGHQFGQYNPQLGDGRALLLGELEGLNGTLWDIQLKGSGPTPYSRGGDGRAALGPVIREYIVSEAMHSMGIRTTRALAAVTTGEAVYRQRSLPGAVLTRVATSHIRIGTFEYFRAQGDSASLKQLADYVIQRHYPNARHTDNPYLSLLNEVLNAQASLVASWLNIGFIHGVMNTDNMTISGETIDYGPCAFMDTYNPATVFSSIDHDGRYAYANQGDIALWNITRFAECLLTLIDSDMPQAIHKAEAVLETFATTFNAQWQTTMSQKLGLNGTKPEDEALIQKLLKLMQKNTIDFTLAFRYLSQCVDNQRESQFHNLFPESCTELESWLKQWRHRLGKQPKKTIAIMQTSNPIYIPRNHIIERVIAAAVEEGDYTPFNELLKVLQTPYEEQAGKSYYALPPKPGGTQYQTFCGT